MDLDAEPIERTLGLVWDFSRDVFILGAAATSEGKTKRQLLRSIFSIFDPLGFLSPIVFQVKYLKQDIWRLKFDWDDELSQELPDYWISWAYGLPSLDGLTLDRCITPKLGFGAVSYARFVYPDGSAEVKFLISKSRVAPLNFMTIPRLELNAAVLAARLGAQVQKEHDINFTCTFYWSDSTTVLSWVKSRSCRFNNYVGNRVGEILETSSPGDWNYVPTGDNPADDASRGLDPSEFDMQHRWFSGPEFLKHSENWPSLPTLPPLEASDPEIRDTTWVGLIQREDDKIDELIKRKSRIYIIINTIAYLFRLVGKGTP